MSLWLDQVTCTFPTARVKDIADVVNGHPFDAADFNEEQGTPLIRIRDLLRGKTQTFVRGAVPASSLVQRGDLVVGMDGDFNSRLWPGPEAALNQRLCVLRSRPQVMDQRFLSYFIGIPLRAINDVTFFTTVKHLSSADLLAERVPAPAVDRQRRIADFLDDETAHIDALVSAKERMISIAQARLRATQHWSHQQSIDQGKATQVRRVFTRRQDDPQPEDPVVTAFRDGQVTSRDLRRVEGYTVSFTEQGYQRVEVGDLVFHGLDGFAGACGVAEVNGKCSGVYHVCVPSPLVLPEFAAMQLQVLAQSGFVALQASSVRERAVDLRNWDKFGSMPIPVPSLETQRDHVARAASAKSFADRMTRTLTTQIALLRERRQALITAAVTGEIEV